VIVASPSRRKLLQAALAVIATIRTFTIAFTFRHVHRPISIQTCYFQKQKIDQNNHIHDWSNRVMFRRWLVKTKANNNNEIASNKDATNDFGIDKNELAIDQMDETEPLNETDWRCPSCDETPKIATTLDGRLLCASQCAYDTESKSSIPYIRGASFIPGEKAKRITNGKINSVLIGKTVDGIVIAFRGTLTSSPIDWLQNAALYMSDVMVRRDGLKAGSRVHVGFYGAVRSLWKPLKATVLQMLLETSSRKKNIYLTGHSKGGALASIAAILMKNDADLPNPTYVATFASVKFGNSEFRDEYNSMIDQTTYESHLDLIPFLPPSQAVMDMMESMEGGDEMMKMIDDIMWSEEQKKKKGGYVWDYQPVGSRRFINENGQIKSKVTQELDNERIQDIEKKTFLSLGKFRAAHCSSCPDDTETCDGGYFRGIAPEICENCDV